MGFVLLAGDLNARTGALQEAASLSSGVPEHIQPASEFSPLRASVDAGRRHNFSGTATLSSVMEMDHVIVNDRSKGDSRGSYTHHSNNRGRNKLGGSAWLNIL